MYLTDLVQKVKKLLGYDTKTDVRKDAVIINQWRRRHPPTTPQPAPAPQPHQPPQPPKPIEHMLNDPSTADLLVEVPAAPATPPQNPIVVRNFKGGGHPRGSVEYQAGQAYVTVAETLNFINEKTPDNKIPHWRRTSAVVVLPRAGVDLNAFYDGRSLQFFYACAPQIGGCVYAVDAADIVSHECGHSILDCYRPDFWDAALLEVGAFHEAFGDFCALMHALSHDQMVVRALQETNGDLSQSNVISRLAEQFGSAIAKIDPIGRDPAFLRNAVNTFKYVDPGSLPAEAPDNQLAAEVHNFSRIMVGAR